MGNSQHQQIQTAEEEMEENIDDRDEEEEEDDDDEETEEAWMKRRQEETPNETYFDKIKRWLAVAFFAGLGIIVIFAAINATPLLAPDEDADDLNTTLSEGT